MNDSVISPRTAPGAIATPASPLIATRIGLAIDDLLATITLTQHYTNREDRAIEVSYTIALPTGAVLLDVEAEIGNQRLRGRVQARVDAEMRYEQALAEGHSAFAIRLVDDQLLNIALGNLKPGESLTLRIVLAQWLLWNGDRVRLTLPTTIAPRYGTSRMQPADQPVVDLLAEHGFRLDGQVRGLLAGAELASATHRLAVRAVEQGIDFAIERGQLDRDIVIDLRDAEQPLRVAGSIAADLAGRDAAMIAFCAAPTAACRRAVVAELVIDCSGSMGGVSIEQTRAAVRAIVAQLTPQDRVNVLRFGSSHQWLLRRPQPATSPVQRTLLQAADDLQADLGGTELLSALNAGLDDLARLPLDVNGERVLFVISDGEVWNLDSAEFLARCTRERVRVFAVAVGSAAVESTFAPLTRATGGSLERVLPSDAMAERIQRHFARVRGGALRELRVRWPAASRDAQGPGELYPGDGALLSAILDANGEPGEAEVSWIDPDGAPRQLRVPLRRASDSSGLAVPSNLARMLACSRLKEIADVAKATRLAIDYQLVTEHSAITLVLERAPGEQLDQLPELRVVPQMLAAGWGGTAMDDFMMDPVFSPPEAPMPRKLRDHAGVAPACLEEYDYLDMPAFLRRESEDTSAVPSPSSAQPAPASAGAVQRFAAKLGAMLRPRKGAQRDGNDASGVRQTDITDAMRRELVALLVARLRADSKLIGALLRGEIGLSALELELSPALFNWLDEQAERQGSDLESGAFWRDLIEQLCSDDSAQGLRQLLGR
jgi:Ca-activated chloride channel family protein